MNDQEKAIIEQVNRDAEMTLEFFRDLINVCPDLSEDTKEKALKEIEEAAKEIKKAVAE
jgi:hypothetical protein